MTLWTPQSSWDRGLERWTAVRRLEDERLPWHEVNQADASLIHLGPDEDATLTEVLRVHPAVVVLHEVPSGVVDLERALGVIVFAEEEFRALRARQRWPVLLAPLPWEADGELSHALSDYKGHAETLLAFADESRLFCRRLTAEDLAARAAREMSLWTADPASAAELPRAAREIHALAAGRPQAVPARRPRAA